MKRLRWVDILGILIIALMAFLAREIFYSLKEAEILIEMWRKQYNTVRPHSALGYRPPAPAALVVQPIQAAPTVLTV